MDNNLVKEVSQLANDLATKSVFSLSGDMPVVGDALKRTVAVLSSFDARLSALEKLAKAPAAGVAGPNVGSKVPPGAQS
jgi:hypothetical protein